MHHDVSAPLRGTVDSGFWQARLAMNAQRAIDHQWRQLEATGCLDNFRLAAGRGEGVREGVFFSDSDAYKWLDAASRLLASDATPQLRQRVDELISLLEAAQTDDGYLYTYNQLLFPDERWRNLQLEHEMYCLGHLIEAGVSHFHATGETRLLALVRRAADLLVRQFTDAPDSQVDGHEEIEIALLRLYRTTGEASYRELARRLLERRGRSQPFYRLLLPQLWRTARRLIVAHRHSRAHHARHPEAARVRLPPANKPKIPLGTWPRLVADLLSGRNFQQHAPLRQQTVPVGHAVRFVYLETAAAMLCREDDDAPLRATLTQAWEHMVRRRMYVTGGLGSLPLIEGFGNDDELDPEVAYAETCAAIGSMSWNHEMACLTGEPRYDDLFEWQLYNAAGVGMGWTGDSYLYNNPLTCRGGISRVGWYLVPCCPSNLSRTWASLGSQVARGRGPNVWITQYLGATVQLDWGTVTIESELPWSGTVRLRLEPHAATESNLHLRLPAWATTHHLERNGAPETADSTSPSTTDSDTACGYTPTGARWLRLRRVWNRGDVLELRLDLALRFHRQSDRVPGCGGRHAVSRGPLVYCIESIDNGDDIFDLRLRADSFATAHDPTHFDGIEVLTARTVDGREVTLIPYMMWGNRGPSRMTVFFELA